MFYKTFLMVKKKTKLTKLIVLSIFLSLTSSLDIIAQRQNWERIPGLIETSWSSSVTPQSALPEYPRPQMVREDNWYNLNGLWKFAIRNDLEKKPTSYDGEILVPFPIESSLSGVKKILTSNQTLWYSREFRSPFKQLKHRTILHFGAVDYEAVVYINNIKVGSHSGGYTEFSFDITDALKEDINEVLVEVRDPTDLGAGPHGKQTSNPGNIYYKSSSGIWQTVWLESVPESYIEGLKITPDVDNKLVKILVETKNVPQGMSVSINGTSKFIGTGSPNEEISIAVPDAHLWSPDDPYLYDIEIKLMLGNKVVDKVASYFGMRKVSIQKDLNGFNRIFLNNKYVYNLGVLDQGFWPDGLYTAPTDDALRFDILACKAMGYNTIRKHIKIEPARWYYHADRLGIIVWQDFVNPNQKLPEGSKDAFEKQISETVRQLYNSPSVSVWVVFNEKWGQYDQKRITEWVKQLDKTRLVNGHSGELLYVNNELRSPAPEAYISSDMADIHSYPNPKNAPSMTGKVQVLGEFGGIGVPIEGHLWDDLSAGWGYDGIVSPNTMKTQFSSMMDSVKKLEMQGLSASIYTQPYDVEDEQNGLMTYDRKVIKLALDTIRKINGRVWVTKPYMLNNKENLLELPNASRLTYMEKMNKFRDGLRDSTFLRTLALECARNGNDSLLHYIVKEYLNNIKNIYSEQNLKFILAFTKRSQDPGFNFLISEREKVNQILGNNRVESVLMNIIYREEISPFDKSPKPNWDSIEAVAARKYGEIGQEQVWGNRVVYYATKREWNNLGKYYKLYFDRVLLTGRNFIHINNLTWPIFEHIDDVDILSTALKATKYSIDNFDPSDPYSIDTYANLLYKCGRRSDAIEWERKAVDLSRSEKVFVETLDKMEKGVPTWK